MPSVEPMEEVATHSGNEPSLAERDTPDPDRQLLPADRIVHGDASPVDLPTVREFTQNDKINKFLLNSFLQRMNETVTVDGTPDRANGQEQEQDFDS